MIFLFLKNRLDNYINVTKLKNIDNRCNKKLKPRKSPLFFYKFQIFPSLDFNIARPFIISLFFFLLCDLLFTSSYYYFSFFIFPLILVCYFFISSSKISSFFITSHLLFLFLAQDLNDIGI